MKDEVDADPDKRVQVETSAYLFGSEAWHQLGNIVPVYGLDHIPQRAQDHVQHQVVVVIGEVIVVRTEPPHLYRTQNKRKRRINLQENKTSSDPKVLQTILSYSWDY